MKQENLVYIKDVANSLARLNLTITVGQLAEGLNESGLTTGYGTEYQGMRGTHTLLAAAWHACDEENDAITAKNIAERILTNQKQAPWL